jgi:hypothetical protein
MKLLKIDSSVRRSSVSRKLTSQFVEARVRREGLSTTSGGHPKPASRVTSSSHSSWAVNRRSQSLELIAGTGVF